VIPYGRQSISEEDIQAVVTVLQGDFLTQGPVVGQFERKLAERISASYVVAVNSATSALHLACLSLGVSEGDLVWTSAISFVASANAPKYCGADVDFVDVDPGTSNISVGALRDKLETAYVKGERLPKVLIPVHMAGQPCDMKEIFELSKQFGFSVIEDASHALGSTYLDTTTGSCAYSDITVFSFHPVKMITTGEGGACSTNNADIAAKLQRLRSHGITRAPSEMISRTEGDWYYEQLDLGFNYRLTDMQAALGISQLTRLPEFISQRAVVADRYLKALENHSLQLPASSPDRTSSLHLFVVRTGDDTGIERRRLFETLRSEGILVNVHYLPIYRQPFYARLGSYNPRDFPGAESYYSTCLSLPIFPGLTEADQDRVIEVLGKPLGHQTIF
jgi:UDP-4-amino-4,6-dideoxy-N-acetyl-beta-L-altrosamine transaminase